MKELKINLTPLIRKLEVFSLRGLTGGLPGEYRSAFKGTGLEFDRYRKYDPTTDDAHKIDWKASLRARVELVREFVEERNIQVMMLVDVSSSMSFGSKDKLKNEYVAELVASMSFAMIRSGDSVGLALFSDKIVKAIKPSIGTAQYYMLLRTLSNPTYYEGTCDLPSAMKELNIWMPRKGTVIIISDFLGWKKEWLEHLKIMGAANEIVGIMVKDPRDVSMPDEHMQVVIKDPYSDADLLIDPKLIKKDYEEASKLHEKELKEAFEKSTGDFMSIRTDEPFKTKLTSFFRERTMRQAR